MRLAYIVIFGVLGVLARYYGGIYVAKLLPSSFPYGTFLINISGAFLIGAIYVFGVERALISSNLRVGIIVGFLGGYTTFSAYCLDGVRLIEDAHFATAGLYFILSPLLGAIATVAGILLARSVCYYF